MFNGHGILVGDLMFTTYTRKANGIAVVDVAGGTANTVMKITTIGG